MLPRRLDMAQFEQAYDAIAEGVDAAGEEKRTLFLAKLALALAALAGDPDAVAEAVAASLRDL